MKLRYSPTSPYARKVLVVAVEVGLADAIEPVATNLADPDCDIATHNPLGKIPALLIEDGTVLYDSPVICEYLCDRAGDTTIIPPAGPERWTALRRQALADGVMDAAVARLLETRRPPSEKSDAWIGRQKVVIDRALDELDREADGFGDAVTIGQIAIGCALGYLDLRFAEDNWRAERPALADWLDNFSARRSMTTTQPKDPV